ncbi:hypothetical protein HYY75_01040 [bacterium]|nr:hypothetical protein [bacterium]
MRFFEISDLLKFHLVGICFCVAFLPHANGGESSERVILAKNLSPEQIEKIKGGIDKYLKKDGDNSSASGDSGNSGDSDTSSESGDSSSSGDSSTSGNSGPSGGQMPTISAPGKIDENDKMFCEAHMKLATRYFKMNNFERTSEELKLIFERVPDFAKGRFMKAVISAKKKDFLDAWRNIEIAQKSAPNSKKIKEFVEKLQKASPKPDVIPEETMVSDRAPPTYASMLIADSLDDFLNNSKVKGKITSFGCKDFSKSDEGVAVSIILAGNDQMNADEMKGIMEEVSKSKVKDVKSENDGKSLEITLLLNGLPEKNPSISPVSGMNEFLEETANECDLKIQPNQESNPDSDKIVSGTYQITAGGMNSINVFLRKLSPKAVDYLVTQVSASTLGEKSIWKGEIQIRFKKGKE